MNKSLEHILQAEIDPAYAKRSELIFRQVENIKPKKILDAGCGRGFYLKSLSFFPFLEEIHGVDINESYLQKARNICSDKRTTIKKASLYSLPYPDNYFDFVICAEVLEHLKEDQKALLEIRRTLQPGGTLIVTVPNVNFPFLWDPLNWLLMRLFNTHVNKDIWWLAGIWADHERLYEKSELLELLRKSNFLTKEYQLLVRWCLPFSHFLLYGIGKNLVEKFGAKDFDRFAFEKKPLATALANLFRLPQKFERGRSHATSVILFVKAVKSS